MPSRRGPVWWLFDKECRELAASPAWWVMLAAFGPLVGFAFINAVRVYGELSDAGGTAAGVGEAFSPLVGVWAPTFSACELAAAFLLPFVAIRLVAGDRQSGALRLEAQHPMPVFARLAIKATVLLAAWLVASAAVAAAVALWRAYGGWVYLPEIGAVAAGHLLNACLTIGLAIAMAAVTEHPATAAILTLSVTVGTWILNFAAAVNGGWWARAASLTPTAMVAEFQRGLIRLDLVIAGAVLSLAGLGLGAIWLRLGVPRGRRARESAALMAGVAVVVGAATFTRASWDVSENRQNSFSPAEEAALRSIATPLRIEAHLAPEDPRRADLEYRALRKLRRVVPALEVTYVSSSSTGLFEQSRDHYGEVWYEAGGRRLMSRVTTADGVLENVFEVTGVPVPAVDEAVFRGHPLAASPRGAGWIFYGVWPITVSAAALRIYRRNG